ncbi:glycosyl hydrolase family 18 protein [Glaciihabitans arcticus]|nr:glycosyl hydrolase family 18 protein [Glaciihabitans arcticus]
MRSVLAGLAVLALAGCAATPALSADAPTDKPLSFTAFQGEWSDARLIDQSADAIDVVAVDGLNLTAEGGVTPASPEALAQADQAHTDGLTAEIMIGNFDADLSDFSEELAWATLSDPARIETAASTVANVVAEQGWDGVSIDLESLEARDTAGLTAFAAALREKLGPAKSLSIALMVEHSAAGYADAGYDLEALVPLIDRFVLMAYDEHGPWEDIPGPIGSLEWQRAGVEGLLEVVPAGQIELGVAGYGYSWGATNSGQLSVEDARGIAGDDAVWDETAGEWTATVGGVEVWWSDIRSFQQRVELAQELGLGGVALWSLETSDPIGAADLG